MRTAERFRLCRTIAILGWAVACPLLGETLTVATYNVENYGPANRVTEAGYRQDYPKPESEKQALRRVIRALNADILVLQEMGAAPYLEELRRDLKREGVDYPHFALAVAADADRHVALLSRRPLKNITTYDHLEFAYFGGRQPVKRGLLEVTVATSAGDVTIFGFHLKSRFTDRPDDPMSAVRRAGEATAVRDAVLKRFPAPGRARFVLLGDCNDGRNSRTIAHLLQRGKTQVAVLVSAADSHGEIWSHSYRHDESYSRVDQIMISPALFRAVAGGVGRIYDGEGVGDASDHRPVLIALQL